MLTATEGVRAVRGGSLKPSDWMAACLDRIRRVELRVHAWPFVDEALAMGAARAADLQDWKSLKPDPILAGLPLGIKDVFNTADMPTAMGSDLWDGFTPGNDARVVAWCKILGAVATGKTATAEFAVHTATSTVNPHDPNRIPGTSSTGSAVAVACGMVPVALGTQTAGSIIRPASYCGVVGFKPSFGLVPRTGVLKTADTLDTIGWLTRTVADARLMLEGLRLRGRNYPHIERGIARQSARRDPKRPWRLALAFPTTWDDAETYAKNAVVEFARQLGNRPDIEVEELDLRAPFRDAHATLRTIYHKQLAYYFGRELKHRDRVSEVFRAITDEGQRTTLDDYLAATKRQTEFQQVLADQLERFDALITLSVAGEAPTWDTPEERDDSSWIWTLCGAPAITLPIFSGPNGKPYGAQIAAPRYADDTLLDLAETVFPGESAVVDGGEPASASQALTKV